ncbi:TetR/AcrR family transcriptional regulator [Microbispora sp. CA-135349]|uniref:TetR/AcrR family transcriptional regulator n=1 Tax=Microbispora sp. CA-135349 TaxID=3239953 RepID=UPI003D8D3EBD
MSIEGQRARNRRGEGGRLREEIVTAATALLEETGSEDAITLRGVARQAGIAAPSIYAHFADRDAVVDAVVARAFAELDAALAAAVEGVDDPAARLRALCVAYLAFAEERPHRYRVAFERRRSGPAKTRTMEDLSGVQAFGRLVTAVAEAGGDGSPELDATALWVALHGYAVLSVGVPAFPWPARQRMLDRLLARFA